MVDLLALLLLASAAPSPASNAQHWPSFRGPRASGIEDGYETPVSWSVEEGEGILWKHAVPGLAHSSPVLWGDRLFLTSAVRKEGEP